MHARFWGTRGSIPSPGRASVRYGGNTPCVEIRTAAGGLVILDAGTGIRGLGRSLVAEARGAPVEGDIFLTHAHWDHVQGLPFFEPLYEAGNRFRIWSEPTLAPRVSGVLREQMSGTAFPVGFERLDAAVELRELRGFHAGPGYHVDALLVRHPGGAAGFRVRGCGAEGRCLVYMSDNELGAAAGDAAAARARELAVGFARGAAVLVHDATYTAAECERHRGWGHSHWKEAVDLAVEAGVERLVLFHHSPDRDDDEIDGMLEACRRTLVQSGRDLRVEAAAEGAVLEV